MDVGGEERSPDAVFDHAPRAHEIEQMVSGDARRHERQRRGRENPSRATDVELGERHVAVALGLGEQDSCDQEARQDEEDIDSHVSALQKRDSGMVERHEQDGDRAESLDVISVPHALSRGD